MSSFTTERLAGLEAEGKIESLADYNYSFLVATDPEEMAPLVRQIAGFLKKDGVNAGLLAPV